MLPGGTSARVLVVCLMYPNLGVLAIGAYQRVEYLHIHAYESIQFYLGQTLGQELILRTRNNKSFFV